MNIFKEIREEKGLTQEDMAKEMGMDQGNYSRLERVYELPRAKKFYQKAFNISGWSFRKFAERLARYVLKVD